MFDPFIEFVRDHYSTNEFIPLHEPRFIGNEKTYVEETITSTFVSSVGAFVDRFENELQTATGAQCAIAVVNGTAALHMALHIAGVSKGDCVITQALTFVATCNAISYCGASPVFVDVDPDTMGLSAIALEHWLMECANKGDDGLCRRRADGAVVRACVPMHTFGHPVHLDTLVKLCADWGITLVEDAAESLGSLYKGRHTGTFGKISALSFNGNKVLTTGGGGALLTDPETGQRAKHLTTTAKQPHPYEFVHDEIGYNYRMPNLNAALGCAQLEQLDRFVQAKRAMAHSYQDFCTNMPFTFFKEPDECRSNYWLNALICENREQRDAMLTATNQAGVMTRPIWTLMTRLPMFAQSDHGDLSQSEWFEDRVINVPSSVVTSLLTEATV